MQVWSDTQTPGTFVLGGAVIPAGTGAVYQFLWCPTARPGETSTGIDGSAIDKAVRTNTNCFMRGVKENVSLRTNSGVAWRWRRICFTMKGDTLNFGDNDPDTSNVARQTSSGMMRLVHQDLATIDRVTQVVFRGQNQTDWVNHFIAPIDTRKISLKFDRTRVIQSNNDSGTVRYYKDWFPMNKNIYYDDQENGDQTFPSMFSVENKQGMGDYYIYDIIEPQGGDSTDAIEFEPQARLYWHEK